MTFQEFFETDYKYRSYKRKIGKSYITEIGCFNFIINTP